MISIRKLSFIIFLTAFILSDLGCSKSKNSPQKQIDITTLLGIKKVLQKGLGGVWEIKNNMLNGHKGETTEDFEFAYNIIPNPKNSEEGRWEAEMVGFTWSSPQRVFAFNESFIAFAIIQTNSGRENKIAKILKMQIVDPPQVFHDFVERHCECTWDLEKHRLYKNKADKSDIDDIK